MAQTIHEIAADAAKLEEVSSSAPRTRPGRSPKRAPAPQPRAGKQGPARRKLQRPRGSHVRCQRQRRVHRSARHRSGRDPGIPHPRPEDLTSVQAPRAQRGNGSGARRRTGRRLRRRRRRSPPPRRGLGRSSGTHRPSRTRDGRARQPVPRISTADPRHDPDGERCNPSRAPVVPPGGTGRHRCRKVERCDRDRGGRVRPAHRRHDANGSTTLRSAHRDLRARCIRSPRRRMSRAGTSTRSLRRLTHSAPSRARRFRSRVPSSSTSAHPRSASRL